MLVRRLMLSLPIALIWMGVTGRVSPGSFLIGCLIGLLVLGVLSRIGVRVQHPMKPSQALAFLTYTGIVLWNGLISSLQVAKLVLSPKIELRTGILAFSTGDNSPEQLLAALSAHGINVTPGQLVIDFDDQGTLYIHCLDLEAARPTLEAEQTRRLHLLRRIIGVKENE
jgi:multicomponent Na+:H+ antiporter subunit E